MAHGPSLLQQYDENNRQKEELLTRMIKAMRSKAQKTVVKEGRPTHPKYALLRLEPTAYDDERIRATGPQELPSGAEKRIGESQHSRRTARRYSMNSMALYFIK